VQIQSAGDLILTDHIRHIAEQLIMARERVQTVARPSRELEVFGLEDGYRVGMEARAYLEKKGFKQIGRKIGFTNRATWTEFNLRTPIWAPVYDETVIYADAGATDVSLKEMVAPRIEPEVVFKFSEPPARDDYTGSMDALLGLVEWVAIGFEIVDCHYPDWEFSAADAVADFGLHARLVIGPQRDIRGKDFETLEDELRTFEAVLKNGSDVVAAGRGENALGSPLVALNYLVKTLGHQNRAEAIRGGEVVTTGTLTPLPHIQAGENWCVEPRGIRLEALRLAVS
jgi:2-oxo-3-hexenedioate decarboxylase